MAKAKPEIDKEAMFRKIMPSSFSPSSAEEERREIPSPAFPQASQPVSQAVQAPEAPVSSGVGVQLHRTGGARVLINIMEYLVVDKLDEAYEKFNNCCKCDKCRQDAAALALNRLKPNYMVIEERQIPYQIAKNNTPEVTSSIVQAILYVKSHPQH